MGLYPARLRALLATASLQRRLSICTYIIAQLGAFVKPLFPFPIIGAIAPFPGGVALTPGYQYQAGVVYLPAHHHCGFTLASVQQALKRGGNQFPGLWGGAANVHRPALRQPQNHRLANSALARIASKNRPVNVGFHSQ